MKSLMLDVMSAMSRRSEGDTQSSRRELVRTLFAAVEGLVWSYRQHVLEVARAVDTLTSEEELAFSERSIVVTNEGKIVEQAKFMPLLAVIRLTTRLAMRVNAKIEARFDAVGWTQFRAALTIRNRVTHPKTELDLSISAEDISICMAGFDWLFELCIDAMMSVTAALREDAAQFRAVLEALERGDPDVVAEYQAAAASLSK